MITPELARTLTELSWETQRQLALLIDRGGNVRYVVVGGPLGIWIPDLSAYRLGSGPRLRGLRYIHTHLKGEPLTRDDLTDLALLRLDLIAVIQVGDHGLPGEVSGAHLIPRNEKGDHWECWKPMPLAQLDLDCQQLIHALEEEFGRVYRGRQPTDHRDRAILVHASSSPRAVIEDSLNELSDLATSAGVVVVDRTAQRRHQFHPRFLMGREKLTDLSIRAFQCGADLLIFDQELNPNQMRAIADLTELRVVDRIQLILDIFAQRAHSREGKLKVELAQMKYLLPRLTAHDNGLSRLTGGIGGRGPGETKLEIDRRKVRDRIHRLGRELDHINRSRTVSRVLRKKNQLPVVSIIGYTNVGKSTLLNALTKSRVYVENKLFATLDPTSRRLRLPRDRDIIVTDTVGFIRNLPKDLLDAFRATLEELKDADLLLHVIDVSHPGFEEQMQAVEKLLEELDLGRTPLLRVFNKADRVDPERAEQVSRLYSGVCISALTPGTFSVLLDRIDQELFAGEGEPFPVPDSSAERSTALLPPSDYEPLHGEDGWGESGDRSHAHL